jgi:hypothetical protein
MDRACFGLVVRGVQRFMSGHVCWGSRIWSRINGESAWSSGDGKVACRRGDNVKMAISAMATSALNGYCVVGDLLAKEN